jgi:hypothetical protein
MKIYNFGSMIKKITILAIATLLLVACGGEKSGNSNLQKAELKLVKLGEKDEGNFASALRKLILSDTSTISYSFQQLVDSGYVSITTSQDGNLRFYDWVTDYSRECVFFDAAFQYRSNGKVYAFEHFPADYDENNNYIQPEENTDYGCSARKIHDVKINGKTYYLVEFWTRYDGRHGVGGINAFTIENDKLKSVNLFKTKTETLNSISIEYCFADWYFRANSDDLYDWLFAFDNKTKTLYVPLIDDNIAFGFVTDQYLLYTLMGDYLEYTGKYGGFWLYPSIRKFNHLVGIYETKGFKIRIDDLGNGYYRYVSWSKGKTMAEKPDLIIENGSRIDDWRQTLNPYYEYIFENKEYTYIVHFAESGKKYLNVQQNDKVILREEIK